MVGVLLEEVGVGAQRDGRAGVAHIARDGDDRDALACPERHREVAEVVHPASAPGNGAPLLARVVHLGESVTIIGKD